MAYSNKSNYKQVSWTIQDEVLKDNLLKATSRTHHYPASTYTEVGDVPGFVRNALVEMEYIRPKGSNMLGCSAWEGEGPLKVSFYTEDHTLLQEKAEELEVKKVQDVLQHSLTEYFDINPPSEFNIYH